MTVLVAAASKDGATRETAKAIPRVLIERDVETEVADVADIRDVAPYEALILGSIDADQ